MDEHAAIIPESDSGGVYGYTFDQSNGRLDVPGWTPVVGAMYLTPGPDGKRLHIATNTEGGGVRTYFFDDAPGKFVEHDRQTNRIDRLAYLSVDNRGRLHATDAASAVVPLGTGPRHMTFHPELPVAYVINEMGSSVTVFDKDTETGALTELETVDTLPDEFEGQNLCADVEVHPAGEWLYASNRGHDSITVMSVNGHTGRLEPVSHSSTRGEWPRHFAISPDGSHLIAENRDSNSVVPFSIEGTTGELTPTGQKVSIPDPICLRFL